MSHRLHPAAASPAVAPEVLRWVNHASSTKMLLVCVVYYTPTMSNGCSNSVIFPCHCNYDEFTRHQHLRAHWPACRPVLTLQNWPGSPELNWQSPQMAAQLVKGYEILVVRFVLTRLIHSPALSFSLSDYIYIYIYKFYNLLVLSLGLISRTESHKSPRWVPVCVCYTTRSTASPYICPYGPCQPCRAWCRWSQTPSC